MPRKRATRAPGAKSKPKQLLQGSVGEDLTEEEKQKKLDVFIQDFKIKGTGLVHSDNYVQI